MGELSSSGELCEKIHWSACVRVMTPIEEFWMDGLVNRRHLAIFTSGSETSNLTDEFSTSEWLEDPA